MNDRIIPCSQKVYTSYFYRDQFKPEEMASRKPNWYRVIAWRVEVIGADVFIHPLNAGPNLEPARDVYMIMKFEDEEHYYSSCFMPCDNLEEAADFLYRTAKG